MAKRFYPRADPQTVADKLSSLARLLREAGWEECGGRLLRDESSGEVIGRTKWVPRATWWAERPHRFSEQQTAGIVLKRLLGERLTPREAACIAHLFDLVEGGPAYYGPARCATEPPF